MELETIESGFLAGSFCDGYLLSLFSHRTLALSIIVEGRLHCTVDVVWKVFSTLGTAHSVQPGSSSVLGWLLGTANLLRVRQFR